MKFKDNGDGTYNIKNISQEMIDVLVEAVADVAAGRAVYRYDRTLYGKWARPQKGARQLLNKFANKAPSSWLEWDTYFEEADSHGLPR